jgi:hypothetical protein
MKVVPAIETSCILNTPQTMSSVKRNSGVTRPLVFASSDFLAAKHCK